MLRRHVRGGLVDQEQHGHADGQAVGDLLEDDAVLPVGDFAFHLQAAIDRAGVHHYDVRLGPLHGEKKVAVCSALICRFGMGAECDLPILVVVGWRNK
jgi:hypothetical protein